MGFPPPSVPVPLGLTGATAATRYVGGTASGAPTSGTFAVGDFVIDRTGSIYICTAAGSPGTWQSPSASASPEEFATGLLAPGAATAEAVPLVATASRAYIVRFVAPAALVVTKIAFSLVVAAGSNDNCDVGIFNAAGTTLLGSAGSTAGKLNAGANTIQTLNLLASVALVANTVYYAAFAYGTVGTTAAQVAMTSCYVSALMGSALPNLIQTYQDAAFPLAAPFTAAGRNNNVPVLGLLA